MKVSGTLVILAVILGLALYYGMGEDLGGGSAASSVQLTAASLYDETGQKIGEIQPNNVPLAGSYITAPDGGEATYATVTVDYELWLLDVEPGSSPGSADIQIDLIKSGIVSGSYVDWDEQTKVQNAIRQNVVSQWTYEGTSRGADGDDYMTDGTVTMRIDSADLVDIFNMDPGQTGRFQAVVIATKGSLRAVKRSGNTLDFRLTDTGEETLVIERVGLT